MAILRTGGGPRGEGGPGREAKEVWLTQHSARVFAYLFKKGET